MIDTILIESDLQSTVHVSGKVAVDLNWISGDRGGEGGGGVLSVVQLQDMNTVQGGLYSGQCYVYLYLALPL